MYVKNKMTRNPHTISCNASISDLVFLMEEKDLKRVPVMNGSKVVGMVTKGDIQKVSPTKATTLSIYELNYLLSKTTVKDAMTKTIYTISPEALLEEAAVLMREKRISSLAVAKEDGILEGIITESDIFDAFIELLGFKEPGTRITVTSKDVPGALADIAAIFNKHGQNISHVANFRLPNGNSDVVVRTDCTDTSAIESDLESNGYNVIGIIKTAK